MAQYYRALADNAASKYGEAVARCLLAESCAKEASRLSASFAASFITTMSPNLPADAGTSINERVKAHLALCTDRKTEAQLEKARAFGCTEIQGYLFGAPQPAAQIARLLSQPRKAGHVA